MKNESIYDRVKARITPEMKRKTRIKLEKTMVENLLKPRWKVIANYPNSPYKIGQILNNDWHEYDLPANELFSIATIYFEAHQYPAIFKKLEWWEERDIEEMPEYVKWTQDKFSNAPMLS